MPSQLPRAPIIRREQPSLDSWAAAAKTAGVSFSVWAGDVLDAALAGRGARGAAALAPRPAPTRARRKRRASTKAAPVESTRIEPERTTAKRKARTDMCVHRVPPTTFCSRGCDS